MGKPGQGGVGGTNLANIDPGGLTWGPRICINNFAGANPRNSIGAAVAQQSLQPQPHAEYGAG